MMQDWQQYNRYSHSERVKNAENQRKRVCEVKKGAAKARKCVRGKGRKERKKTSLLSHS